MKRYNLIKNNVWKFSMILLLIFPYPNLISNMNLIILKDNQQSITLRASIIFSEEIFTIKPPKKSIFIPNINLVKNYSYELSTRIVTPHSCIINLTLIDSKEKPYLLYFGKLDYYSDELNQIKSYFGASTSGNHSVIITIFTNSTLNIAFKITKKLQCLEEFFPVNLYKSLILYKISRFDQDTCYLEYKTFLDKNKNYTFYLAKVTSNRIHDEENSSKVSLNLTDVNGNEFEIYSNEEMPGIEDYLSFKFQTAVNGVHTIEIKFKQGYFSFNLCILGIKQLAQDDSNNNNPDNLEKKKVIYFLPLNFLLEILSLLIISTLPLYILFFMNKLKKKKRIKN
ncbi:MAG: hypothetical protein ACTSPH_09800 [Promethearchaeota archaeon]